MELWGPPINGFAWDYKYTSGAKFHPTKVVTGEDLQDLAILRLHVTQTQRLFQRDLFQRLGIKFGYVLNHLVVRCFFFPLFSTFPGSVVSMIFWFSDGGMGYIYFKFI